MAHHRDIDVAAASLLHVVRDAGLRPCRDVVDLEVMLGGQMLGAGRELPPLSTKDEPAVSFVPLPGTTELHTALMLDLDADPDATTLLWMKANLRRSSVEVTTSTLLQRWTPTDDGRSRRLVALCCQQDSCLSEGALAAAAALWPGRRLRRG